MFLKKADACRAQSGHGKFEQIVVIVSNKNGRICGKYSSLTFSAKVCKNIHVGFPHRFGDIPCL